MTPAAKIMAGVPVTNQSLYHRIRFSVGDSAACIEVPDENGQMTSILLLRDVEMGRARQFAAVDRVGCSADFPPEGGLSDDRDTALAQAAAECLRRAGVTTVTADRSLPLIFAEMVRRAGIEVHCDLDMGVFERRQ